MNVTGFHSGAALGFFASLRMTGFDCFLCFLRLFVANDSYSTVTVLRRTRSVSREELPTSSSTGPGSTAQACAAVSQ